MTASKSCSKCGEEKPLDGFPTSISHNGKSYPRNSCLVCFNAQRKAKDAAYRERNRERVKEQARRWARDNTEVSKRWYEAHREEILEKSRKERAEANKGPRLALAKRQKERSARQIKYAARREAAKALRDNGLKKCAVCGEEKPVSDFGVVIYSSGTQGPRSNCYECRRSSWNSAAEEEKVERREINNKKHRLRRGAVRMWNPPALCSAKGCTTPRAAGGRSGPIKEGVLCQKHYAEKQRRDLADTYVSAKLKRSFGVANPPPQLIELKRIQLRITRQLRTMAKAPAN
jgi:hypothetical protein